MKTSNLMTVTVIATGCVMASLSVLASSPGDLFVRGGIAQTDTGSHNGEVAGSELGFEHDLTRGGGEFGSADRIPVNLLVNYYPLGGMGARVQPYMGAGLNYARFSGEDTPLPIDVRHSYGAIGQLRVDLAVAQGLKLNGFVSYADVSADVRLDGDKIGKAKIDPMAIGGGITYRF